MASLPARPPAGRPPLPPGWTEHKAPTGHTYYYNKETKASTYTRPIAQPQNFHSSFAAAPPPASRPPSNYNPNADLFNPLATPLTNTNFNPNPQQQNFQRQNFHHATPQQDHGGGHRGGHHNFQERRRQQPEDRPKHRYDIPNCQPWVLVKTKLGRRFVWNKDTNESFWKFPPDIMKGVVEFDRIEREKRERRQRGEQSEDENDTMADIEAEIAAAEEEISAEVVEVEGDLGMENEEEYEEMEVTDDEEEKIENPSKRQRTEEPPEDQPLEMGEDDIAWQLAAMEEGYDEEEEEEGLPLTEEDCKALFKELLDDTRTNPYTPWEKVLDSGLLYDDERYKALPTMKARKDCWDEWSREKIHFLKEQRAKQEKTDPKIPYFAFLQSHATPKLFWQEFRRKFKKEPEMKDTKISDKDREKWYREHINRLKLPQSTLKSDLSALLKAQPLALLNRSTTLNTLPSSILTDLRFISLPTSTRDSLVETFISTLPPAPEDATALAEDEAQASKRQAERERRERALAERERRVREDKKKQQRDLQYGKGRLREEEMEIERAMRVGKEGLRGQLGNFEGDGKGDKRRDE
ncbi:hypothetical protein K469DRAFT_734588 [Zopfia rhizophila CBS 207.26]|uniref:WW domain-containing protein n=1 Tax=Zopfia rhizophila CBS 207.26 TaxID=1314779 RepID=A0A6A6ER02_9PEZI|nr:hypothetical protein K469DRAFT_734588 [Zopfia rhizophila CBS 207.26]